MIDKSPTNLHNSATVNTRRSTLRRPGLRHSPKWLTASLAAFTAFSAMPNSIVNAEVPSSRYGTVQGTNNVLRGTISNLTTLANNSTADSGVFVFRSDTGENLRVILHQDILFLGDSRFFNSSSRVEVEGVRDGDILIARDVRVFDNNRYLSILRGVVTSDVRNGRFNVTLSTPTTNRYYSSRSIAARTIQINARNAALSNVRRGDEVELRGTWQGNGRFTSSSVFNADSVAFINDSDGYYPGDDIYLNGRQATLRGYVQDNTSNNTNTFRLSLRNNQVIMVRGNNNNTARLNRNDYVEVRGRYDQNSQTFRADSVRVLDARTGDQTSRVDFAATIVSFNSNNRITVRGDNGRTYEVIAPITIDRNISRGDRVRIVGTVNADGTTLADSVILENGYGDSSYTTLDFTGTITQLPGVFNRDYFTVRTSEGREFRVNFRSTTNLRIGDRVRVRGRVNNGIVDADSIVRI